MSNIPTYNNPFEFDMLMLEPVHEMMMTGIRVDQEKKAELQAKKHEEWMTQQEQLNKIVGFNLNVEGKKQVPDLLYRELGMPVQYKKDPKTRGKKETCDEAALRNIMAACKGQIDSLKTDSAKAKWMQGYLTCRLILKIRGVRKQLSSFLGVEIKKGQVKGFTDFEDKDGRIRGTISVGGAETARLTHSKTLWGTGVNLATIPLDLKSMLVADDGYELAEFDLNRGESWVYAHLSEDPELIRIHVDGLDFHAETAAAISSAFGEEVTVEWIVENKNGPAYKIRYLGKRTNHASSYRMKEYKAAEITNGEAEDTGITVTVGDMKKAQNLWHQKYFNIKSKWWPEIEAQLNTDRTMRTPYGRVHVFHDFWGENLFKSATAYVPQSTSVDYLNRGFLRVYHSFQKTGAFGLKVLAQTHDSILVMYKDEYRDEVIPSVIETMTSELTIKGRTFSIPVEAGYGHSWKDAK